MKIEIYAKHGYETEGCVRIPYRGYTLSLTTIGIPGGHEIAVFSPREVMMAEKFRPTAEGLKQAMQFVDEELAR